MSSEEMTTSPLLGRMDRNEIIDTRSPTCSTISHTGDAPDPTIVTERYLLARAKDERYVEQCTKLLLQMLQNHPFRWEMFQRWCSIIRNGTATSYNHHHNKNTPSPILSRATRTDDSTVSRKRQIVAEYISWILYILLTTKSRRHHCSSTNSSLTTPGMEICQVEYTKTKTNSNIIVNASTSLTGKVSPWAIHSFLQHLTSTAPLLSMTTLWYGIRFWSFQMQQKERRRNQQEESSQSPNYNHLTGQSRQDAFYTQRQDMIRRSKNIRMKSKVTTPPATNNGHDKSVTSQSVQQRILHLYETFIISIDTAIQSLPLNGPHDPTPPSSSNGAPMLHQNSGDWNYTSPTSFPTSAVSSPTLIHVIQWMYQFYMAYYYLHGTYPTLLHRWFHIRPVSNVANQNTNSQKMITMIGTLMMFQLSWKLLIYGISQPALEYWIQMQPLIQRTIRQLWSRWKKTLGIPNRGGTMDGRQRTYIYMEGTAPMLKSTRSIDGETKNSEYDDNDPPTNVLVCGICRNSGSTCMTTSSASASNNSNPILFPSCSIRCGHVFCWYCIQQWLTYYDTKCPICRTTCTTNEIQLLYNY